MAITKLIYRHNDIILTYDIEVLIMNKDLPLKVRHIFSNLDPVIWNGVWLETLNSLAESTQSSAMGQYMRGVCFRLMRDFANAESALRQLVEGNPSYGRAFQELGHLYRDANMPTEALNAYATACHLNPGLKASWAAQRDLIDKGSLEHFLFSDLENPLL